jgi:hypothetical protein
LRNISDHLKLPAGIVTNAVRSFLTSTQRIEPAWGTGTFGRTLEPQYRPGYNDLVDLLEDLVGGLGSVGERFVVASNNVVLTEEVNQT